MGQNNYSALRETFVIAGPPKAGEAISFAFQITICYNYFCTKENAMTAHQATVEVFLTAFKALPRQDRDAFLFTIIKDPMLREDVIDLAIATKRNSERCKGLRTFVKSLKGRKR